VERVRMTPVLFLTMGRAAALAVRKWVVAPVTIGRAKSSSGISRSDVLARGCRLPLLFRAAPRWSRPSGGGCHDRPLVERELPSPNREAAAPHTWSDVRWILFVVAGLGFLYGVGALSVVALEVGGVWGWVIIVVALAVIVALTGRELSAFWLQFHRWRTGRSG
jgi:hypothetical protein